MTELKYLEDTYLFKSKAKIICSWENELWEYIILDKTIFYPDGYRGMHFFERITYSEIEALQILIMYHAIKDDIRLTYNHDMWDISERAVRGAEGIWSHTSYRTDKLDIHPQAELVSMLMNVEDDFYRIFNPKDIKLLKTV